MIDSIHSLSLVLPEEVLSGAGLVLLLVAAWAGDKASRIVTVGACLALAWSPTRSIDAWPPAA